MFHGRTPAQIDAGGARWDQRKFDAQEAEREHEEFERDFGREPDLGPYDNDPAL